MAKSPLACGEPMTLELLSPADRPLQVTNDLASFWNTTYPAIRAELARRYPKHYWPIDPLVAKPTRGPHPKPNA
jgi:ATP-dependent helicase HrpB